MNKFRVSVHGKNYKIGIAKRRFFRMQYSESSVGFSTTRFVKAETANDAIKMVFESLRKELEHDGRTTQTSVMELEGICEDEDGYDAYAPGGGYTFYEEEGT